MNEPVAHFYPEGEGATVYDIKFVWKVTGTTEPIPLYTHPVKELTDEQIFKLAEMLEIKMNHALYAFARTLIKNAQENLECYKKLSDASKMASKPISEKSRAILRKAQEK